MHSVSQRDLMYQCRSIDFPDERLAFKYKVNAVIWILMTCEVQ